MDEKKKKMEKNEKNKKEEEKKGVIGVEESSEEEVSDEEDLISTIKEEMGEVNTFKRMASNLIKKCNSYKNEMNRFRGEQYEWWNSRMEQIKEMIVKNNEEWLLRAKKEQDSRTEKLKKMEEESKIWKEQCKKWEAAVNKQEIMEAEIKELKEWKVSMEARINLVENEDGNRELGDDKDKVEEKRKKREEDRKKREEEKRSLKRLEWLMEEKKREKIRNNIIITGLQEGKKYEIDEVNNWLKDEIGVEANILKVWKVRTRTEKFKLGAQCETWQGKQEVMKNKNKLGEKKVFIDNELTWRERKNMEEVRKKTHELRQQGKLAKIGYNKIRTNEGIMVWNEKKKRLFRKGEENEGGENQLREQREYKESRVGKEKKGENIKIIFWNVAETSSMMNEDWKYMKEYDIIGLTETWEEEGKMSWSEKKLKDYKIKQVKARRIHKKGTAIGGILLAVKKSIAERIEWIERETEEVVGVNFKNGKSSTAIGVIYMRQNRERNLEMLEEWMSREAGKGVIIGGDFNARTGKEGGLWNQEGKKKKG